MCFLGVFIEIIIVFFVYPFPMRTHRILLDSGHFSRIGFVIGSTFFLEGTSLIIAASASMVTYKKRMKIWASNK